MKRNARPSLFDLQAAFDDPLEMLLACHRRIERQLQTLERLQVHLEVNGVDAEASAAAQAIVRYFVRAAENHHEDEERDLFPLLEERIPSGEEKARFHALRERLEADHHQVREMWSRLKKTLDAVGDGMPRTLQPSEVRAFVDAYTSHIGAEETALKDLFERWIDADDRRTLGLSMSARRAAPSSPAPKPVG
jgi:pyridoxamine 5'-phosphate oxidase